MSMYVNDNSLFDVDLQTQALRLLTVRSPGAAFSAARVLTSACGAARQGTIDACVAFALGDPQAEFTVEERELLVSAMGTPPSDGGEVWTPPQRRPLAG